MKAVIALVACVLLVQSTEGVYGEPFTRKTAPRAAVEVTDDSLYRSACRDAGAC